MNNVPKLRNVQVLAAKHLHCGKCNLDPRTCDMCSIRTFTRALCIMGSGLEISEGERFKGEKGGEN